MSYVGCCCDGLGASGSGCPPEAREISKILNDNADAVQVVNSVLTVLGQTTMVIGVGAPILGTVGFISYLKAGCDGKQTLRELSSLAKTQAALTTLVAEGVGIAAQFGVVTAPPGWVLAAVGAVSGAIAGIAKDLSEGKTPSVGSLATLFIAVGTTAGTLGGDTKSVEAVSSFLKSDTGKAAINEVEKNDPRITKKNREAREAAYKAMSVPEKIAYQKKVIKTLESVNNYPVKGQYDNQIRIAKKEIEALEKPDAKAAAKEAEKKRKEELAKGIESATTRGKAAGSTQAIKDQAAKEAQAYAAALKSKKSSVALPLAAAGAGFLALGPVGAAAGAGAGLIFSALSRSKKSSK